MDYIVEEIIESAYQALNPLTNAEIKAIETFSKIIENAHNATHASDVATASEIVHSSYRANEVDEIITQVVELAYNGCNVKPSPEPPDEKINKNDLQMELTPDVKTETDTVLIVECIDKIDDCNSNPAKAEKALKIDSVELSYNCTVEPPSEEPPDVPEGDEKTNKNDLRMELTPDVKTESGTGSVVDCIDKVDDCNSNQAKAGEALKIDSVELSYNCTVEPPSEEPSDVPEGDEKTNKNDLQMELTPDVKTESDTVLIVECIDKIDDCNSNPAKAGEALKIDSVELAYNCTIEPPSEEPPDVPEGDEKINENDLEMELTPDVKTESDTVLIVECIDKIDDCNSNPAKAEKALKIDSVELAYNCTVEPPSEEPSDVPEGDEKTNKNDLQMELTPDVKTESDTVLIVECIDKIDDCNSNPAKAGEALKIDSVELAYNCTIEPPSEEPPDVPEGDEKINENDLEMELTPDVKTESDTVLIVECIDKIDDCNSNPAKAEKALKIDSVELAYNCTVEPPSEEPPDVPEGDEKINENDLEMELTPDVKTESDTVLIVECIDKIDDCNSNPAKAEKALKIDSVELAYNCTVEPPSEEPPDVPEGDEKTNENDLEMELTPDVKTESGTVSVVDCIDKIDDCNQANGEVVLQIDSVAEHFDCETQESDESIVVDSIEICKNEEDMPSIEIIPDEPSGMEHANSVRESSARDELYSDDELHNRGYFMKFIGDVKRVTNLSLPLDTVGISKVLCRLPPDVTDNELIPLLEKCGRICELRYVASGVVIVTYMSEEESTNAIKMLNGRIVRGSALKVEKFIEKNQLHVSPVPVAATKPELFAYFGKLTRGLAQVYILHNPENAAKNRGYCYLTYRDYECASVAREIISNSVCGGRKMSCDYAERQLVPGDTRPTPPLFKIFMNNLRPGLASSDLRKLFSSFGNVIEVDKNNNWASVKFRHPSDAKRALQSIDKRLLGNDANISLSPLPEN